MSQVDSKRPISGRDLNLPELPPEQPASDLPLKITHAKSEQKARDAQRRCSKTTKKMSPDISRQHVATELEKKSSSAHWGKSLINNIKDKFRHSTGLSKRERQSRFSSAGDAMLEKEYKPETHTVRNLQHRLGKVLPASDTDKKQQLSFTIRQCFGLADGEPDNNNLHELLRLLPEFKKHPESLGTSTQLEQKISEIFKKKNETINESSKNMVMVEKTAVTGAPEHAPTPQLQTLTNAEIIEHELDSIERELEEDIFNAELAPESRIP